TALAVHQVEAPQVAEAAVEAGGEAPLGLGRVEACAPRPQRLGVVAAEVLLVLPRKSACPRQIPELAGLDQQTAGKHVSLDEIGVAGIALEQVVAHGDELDRRAPAGLEVARQA